MGQLAAVAVPTVISRRRSQSLTELIITAVFTYDIELAADKYHMQKKTRSILEELDVIYQDRHQDRDRRYIIESRASNVIASAIRLIEQIEQDFSAEQAENLTRKLLNAIRDRDPAKFTRTVRRADAH